MCQWGSSNKGYMDGWNFMNGKNLKQAYQWARSQRWIFLNGKIWQGGLSMGVLWWALWMGREICQWVKLYEWGDLSIEVVSGSYVIERYSWIGKFVNWAISRGYANEWIVMERDICHWSPSVGDGLLLGICEQGDLSVGVINGDMSVGYLWIRR